MEKKETFSYDKNLKKLNSIFDNKFIEKSENSTLSTEEIIKANELLAVSVYGEELASYVKKYDIDTVLQIYNELLTANTNKLHNINIDFNKVGLMLVRPEVYNVADNFEKFMVNKGLKTLLKKDIRPTLEQYLVLYPHGICIKDAQYDFPTRTFNYVDNDCKLIVFYGNTDSQTRTNIPDYMNYLKGKLGSYKPDTLRSDVAYQELLQYIKSRNQFQDGYNTIFDPISAYRHLVDNKLPNDNDFSQAQNPLLFYAGQAVHIPTRAEIERDFCALLAESDIKTVERNYTATIDDLSKAPQQRF